MKKIILLILFLTMLTPITGCVKEFQTTFYDISLEYLEGSVQYCEEVRFCAQTDDFSEAYFNLYPLAYEEGQKYSPVTDGRYAAVDILEVSCDNKRLEYSTEDSFLKVKLGKTYKKNDKINIKLKVNIKLPYGKYRMARSENTVNLGNVFALLAVYDGDYIKCDYGAIGDPFVSETADFKVSITVPSTYVVAGGGNPVSTDVGENKTKYLYEQKGVRDFAFAISEKYQVKMEKWGDKLIYYYFLSDENADKTILCEREALKYFSQVFGEYPYDVFCACQTEFINGGMEYPLLVYLADNLPYENYLYALVHEIAHQWWYGMVGNNQIEESYLDESLAEYSAYMFFDEHGEYGIDGDLLVKNAASAAELCERAVLEVNPMFVPAVKKPLGEFKSEYEYVNMVYSKGFLMFKSLENLTSRDYVTERLKNYFQSNEYKIAKTEDLLRSFSDDVPFFLSFLNGKTRVFL